MNRINIESAKGKRYYTAPAEWNELTRKQLFIWSGLVRQSIPVEWVLKSAVLFFYGIRKKVYERLTPAQKAQLSGTLGYLVSGNSLTSNVIGSFRLFLSRYYGPANRLSNLTIAEYRRTELYYQLYLRTKEEFYLNLLCATLFRPRGFSAADDVRCEIGEIDLQARARTFKWMHPNLRHSILLFYEGCRAYIVKAHPVVFKQSGAGAPSKTLFDLEETILAVSGDKFGTFKETQSTNLYLFLKQLTDRKEEADALKRKAK